MNEWPADLDVERVLAGGFRPTAFREFVFKINQRCNLACDYCYIYDDGRQTWRDPPGVDAGRGAAHGGRADRRTRARHTSSTECG